MQFPPESLNRGHFDDRTNDGIVMVDFWASWCPPCRQQLEILEQMTLGKQLPDGVRFYKVNVDDERQLASFYHVETVPTWVGFRHGSLVFRHSGVLEPEALQQAAAYCRKNFLSRLFLRIIGKRPGGAVYR